MLIQLHVVVLYFSAVFDIICFIGLFGKKLINAVLDSRKTLLRALFLLITTTCSRRMHGPAAPRAELIQGYIVQNFQIHAIRLRHDYDPTTYRARLLPFDARKNEHVNFSS